MTSLKALTATFEKDFGKNVGNFGGAFADVERVPTGLFQLDRALGGGFPRGKNSLIFGRESSGKTNICLCAIREHQRVWPNLTCVFIDLENSFDPVWAAKIGVDVSRLYVAKPDYAEQAVDMIDAMMYTDDIGLIIVDSLAGFISLNETESSSEKALVGGSALLVGKLYRKLTRAQSVRVKQGFMPTVIAINQTREKVGVMYGSNETMPGGNPPKFFSSMILRVTGTNIMDSKVSKTIPVIKQIECKLKKWKVPVLNVEATVKHVVKAHGHLGVGESDDWNSVSNALKDYGLLTKDKAGYTMLGEQFKLLGDCKDKYQQDKGFAHVIRKGLIEKALEDEDLIGAQDGNEPLLEEAAEEI